MFCSCFHKTKGLLFFRITGILILFACFYQVFSQVTEAVFLRGNVYDPRGLPVAEMEIRIIFASGKELTCSKDTSGGFACPVNLDESFTVVIQAEGFPILRQKYDLPQDFSENKRFRLSPAPLREEVLVTANRTRTRLGETAASIVSLSREELSTTAAPAIDDKLRQVAGFSLFRRTGSRHANPTSQGVSLRGVGASGSSRTMVLFDGVPLSDIFGGWILWSRVPPILVERIEVLRGGASSLYGSDSLSGTINILPRRVNDKFVFSAEIYAGTQNTFSASTFSGFSKNKWSADLVASHFQTQGYVLVDKSERGTIDVFAGSRNINLSGRIAKNFNQKANVYFKTSYFEESRTNGTPAQINRTHLREFVTGGDALFRGLKSKFQDVNFEWRVFGGTQAFEQSFSAVSPDRNSESLVRRQRIPAQNFGFSGQISGVFLKNQTITAGLEAREVRGASDETGFFNNRLTSVSGAGGREQAAGFFVQDFARVNSKFILAGSFRFDFWKNFRALSLTRTLSNNETLNVNFSDRNETAFSPQISGLYQISRNFSIFAVGSGSFRAPTLNELYRGFRVGNIVTFANENLRAEKASNFEAGVSFNQKKLYFRGNFFYTEIKNPVSNVTLLVSPNLITRQRQNIGKTRTTGFEIETEKRFRQFAFSLSYLLTDSRVIDFPANRILEGLFIPQAARHQFTFQMRYAGKDWTLALQGRGLSKQFDDDLNTLRLEPFFQLDAFLAKRFKEKLEIFTAVENIFNSRYSIAKTPVRSVSPPAGLRVGIRWN